MRRQSFVKFVVVFGILVIGMVVYVWEQVKVTDLRNEIDTLYLQKQQIIEENKRLEAEIVQLSSAPRIKKIAAEKLGMLPSSNPPEELIVRLRE